MVRLWIIGYYLFPQYVWLLAILRLTTHYYHVASCQVLLFWLYSLVGCILHQYVEPRHSLLIFHPSFSSITVSLLKAETVKACARRWRSASCWIIRDIPTRHLTNILQYCCSTWNFIISIEYKVNITSSKNWDGICQPKLNLHHLKWNVESTNR